jgi:hypothetical protein
MKNIFTLSIVVAVMFTKPFTAFSQDKSSTSTEWLDEYYNIKDALVNSNPTTAASAAKKLSTLVQTSPAKKPAGNQANNSKSLQQKIQDDANAIAASKDLAKQRIAFQALSESIISLIKTEKQLKPAYIMYCPMKKAYWISSVEQIKNPYYGSSMLTCGNVSETLK